MRLTVMVPLPDQSWVWRVLNLIKYEIFLKAIQMKTAHIKNKNKTEKNKRIKNKNKIN